MEINQIGNGASLTLKKIITNKVKYRNDFLFDKIKNKKILDIGCIGHKIKHFNSDSSLHSFLKKHSKKVTGMDYLKKEVSILRKKGHDVIYGNAEDFDFKQKYELIIAGELIEHLNNPGNFLKSAKRSIKKNGSIIITTPNTFSFRNLIFSLLFVDPPVNSEHTMYFDPITLKRLIENNGLKIKSSAYTFIHTIKPLYYLEYLISLIKPSFAPTIIFELKK